jgi:hypothetical protein
MRITILAAALLAASPALAHRAPSGWSYDLECCNTLDCAPAPARQIREQRRDGVLGYAVVVPLGTHHHARVPVDDFVPMGDPRIRVSGDADRHVCLSRIGRVLCIYIPPGGV